MTDERRAMSDMSESVHARQFLADARPPRTRPHARGVRRGGRLATRRGAAARALTSVAVRCSIDLPVGLLA